MPQQRSKHGPKAPAVAGKCRAGRQGTSTGNAAESGPTPGNPDWQRSQGGFSSKAKKDYLKWKRQQKAAAREDSSGSDADECQPANTQRHAPAAADGPVTDAPTSSLLSPCQQQRPSSSAFQGIQGRSDPTAPLRYRPLVAVSAAPFCASQAAAATAAAPPGNNDSSVHAPGAAAAAAAAKAASVPVDAGACSAYMPRLDPAEVGFTPEGFSLDMPTRPQWRGVVHNAEQLHALEEQQFEAWQAALMASAAAGTGPTGSQHSSTGDPTAPAAPAPAATPEAAPEATPEAAPKASPEAAPEATSEAAAGAAGGAAGRLPSSQQQQQQQCLQGVVPGAGTARAGGVGRLSFFEGRLDFWRQLWRTLELSDVVLLIVDARNPLLHFSHALYRHITQHHRLPLLLLLNKCDLVPAAAVAAWQQWLQQQLPGVAVVPVSAAPSQAPAAARAVLAAVMKLHVERAGQQVAVSDVVGASVDELVEASITRNTHAKRHIMQQQQQGTGKQEQGNGAAAAPEAAAAAGPASEIRDVDDEEEEAGDDWSMKPTRAARKSGKGAPRRRGQQQQQQSRKQQQHRKAGCVAAGSGPADGDECALGHGDADSSAADAADSSSDDAAGSSDDDGGSSPEQCQLSMELERLTVEHQLSSRAHHQEGDSSSSTGRLPCSADSGSTGPGTSSSWQLDSRPVVLGLLGEPNVGKSSTLNALLGSHRVAVSAHPGRTKHYQTHFMSERLVLCDCPGIVFPRLDVSLPMQVLFGSYPIANCRDLYSVVSYLAAASWPRLHQTLALTPPDEQRAQSQTQLKEAASSAGPSVQQALAAAAMPGAAGGGACCGTGSTDGDEWSAWSLCEALAAKRHWVLPRSGRLDTYRAANWLLRAALAGKGLGLAFLPPPEEPC